jgi:hypothetical protein
VLKASAFFTVRSSSRRKQKNAMSMDPQTTSTIGVPINVQAQPHAHEQLRCDRELAPHRSERQTLQSHDALVDYELFRRWNPRETQ